MQRVDPNEATLAAYSSAESRVDHLVDCWAPPITATEPSNHTGLYIPEEAFSSVLGAEHLFQPIEQSDLHQILTSFASRRRLIAGSAVVATLGLAVLAYVLWPPAPEKITASSAETTAAIRSSAVAPVRAPPGMPAPYLAPVTAWPDPPPVSVAASPQVVAATVAVAPTGETGPKHQTGPARQNQDIAFVQHPGVNIRSAPSSNGSVLGIVPKGKRFKVTKREGDWVQVDSDYLKGWIKSQFLGPNEPRS